jgi:glutamine amidotransferase
MLKRIGSSSVITSDKELINEAEKLILPGVGSFDYGMEQLDKAGIIDIINQKVLIDKTPILGICLGVQLFTQGSEEGQKNGLGWFNARTIKFDVAKFGGNQKIPHMGWSEIEMNPHSRLFNGFAEIPRFYFVHSYHLHTEFNDEITASAVYGYQFTAALEKENIVGVQFHPEKSHKFGMQVLKNFVENY